MIKTLFRQWGASLCLGFLALASQAPAAAQDLPGAKDHPAVKRFGGSTIVGYEVRNFDAVEFQTSTFKEFDLQAHKRRYLQPRWRSRASSPACGTRPRAPRGRWSCSATTPTTSQPAASPRFTTPPATAQQAATPTSWPTSAAASATTSRTTAANT